MPDTFSSTSARGSHATPARTADQATSKKRQTYVSKHLLKSVLDSFDKKREKPRSHSHMNGV